MTTSRDTLASLVEDARAAPLDAAFATAGFSGLKRAGGQEFVGPCPACGGVDCFSLNTAKGKWNCRKAGFGGNDATGMVAHCLGLDTKTRGGLAEAAAAALGVPVPEPGEAQEERAVREKKLAAKRQEAAREAQKREKSANAFRDREIAKARGKWERAIPLGRDGMGKLVAAGQYLVHRCGLAGVHAEDVARLKLRFLPDETLWHGEDDAGRPVAVHSGPALVGAFVDFAGEVIGCHLTWIDLDRPPKFRPLIYASRAASPVPDLSSGKRAGPPAGRCAARSSLAGEQHDKPMRGNTQAAEEAAGRSGRPAGGAGHFDEHSEEVPGARREAIPTKKMRGTKKGGLIPLAGDPSATRWVGGEGIENGLAVAGVEGFRADTFYFAAGDLGNLAGPHAAKGRVAHPYLKTEKGRAQMLPSPHPREDQTDPSQTHEAMWVGAHVTEILLLGDGDSEPCWTAAMMACAKRRIETPQRDVTIAWPEPGKDFSQMVQEQQEATSTSARPGSEKMAEAAE